MANEIYYCSRCNTRLFGNQFVDGTAYRVRDKISCQKCLGDIIAPLSVEEQQDILLQVKALQDSAQFPEVAKDDFNPEEFFELDSPDAPADDADFFELDTPDKKRKRAGVPVTSKSAAVEESQNRAAVVFLLCLFGIAAIGFTLYVTSDPDRPTTPIGEKPAPAPYRPTLKTYAEQPSAPSPRADEARAALEKAREFARANPNDLAGQEEAFKKAGLVAEGTPIAMDARKEYDQNVQAHKELIQRDLAPLDKQTAEQSEKEEFKPAMDRLEQAKDKYNLGEWRGGVDLRLRSLKTGIWKIFLPLRDKAVEAKQKKNEADLKAVVDRVAKWGLSEFTRELDNALGGGAGASTTPPVNPTSTDVKPRSEEAKTYEIQWRQALELASRRDYEAALAALDKTASGLKDPAVKADVAADLDALRSIQAIYRDAVLAIGGWGRNEKIPLEFIDENLSTERVEDPYLRSDSEKVEVARGGGAYAIEFAEITARSLANVLRKKKGSLSAAESKAAALMCLVEGDADAARQNLSGSTDQAPFKYWSLAAKIAESRSGSSEASKREMAARKAYFTAERSYADVKSRAGSIQMYRELLNTYAGTAIVERRRAQIQARRDNAKDYVFMPDDMDVAGTFKSGKQPKFGVCWASDSDSDPSQGKHNYVNVKFYAFPDVTYQCWAYVGGCCFEVLGASYQATDLTHPNPKGGEPLKMDPGSNSSLTVRHTISFLKQTHAAHLGPKEPKSWEWVELKLPRYKEPGIKDVRLMTDQKAFSVAFLVVSAIRNGPPGDAEMKSWFKKPDAVVAAVAEEKPEAVAAVVEPRDPSLVGHWKLDETGATALDSSGRDNTGVLVNDPSRVPGKSGGGILLDGKARYVNIPNSEALDKIQADAYTVACWFKPNSKPGEPNDPAYALVAKSEAHEGLTYTADQKFVMDHFLASGPAVSAVTASTFAPGNYYHVAGVVSRSEGIVRIYVNGKLEGTANFTAGAAARDFKNETWRLGIALPGTPAQRLSADGIIDEVRLYSRALPAGDLKTAAGISGGAPPSIVIVSPIPGEKFEPPATVTLQVAVTPADRIAKVDFYSGSTLLATKTGPPYTHTWSRVAGGQYTITARATDRSGTVYTSAPLMFRVGNPVLYRALNLGGGSMRIDGVEYEGKGAKGISTNGTPFDVKAELTPSPDASLAPLLKKAMVHNLGTSVSLIGIPNATYQISLYVVSEGNPQIYDIVIAGKVVQAKVQSGPAGTWQKLGPWVVDSSGGLLEVAAKGGEANFCALEVWRVSK